MNEHAMIRFYRGNGGWCFWYRWRTPSRLWHGWCFTKTGIVRL